MAPSIVDLLHVVREVDVLAAAPGVGASAGPAQAVAAAGAGRDAAVPLGRRVRSGRVEAAADLVLESAQPLADLPAEVAHALGRLALHRPQPLGDLAAEVGEPLLAD